MQLPGFHTAETQFVDTPKGIFTASGVWFRTTEALLRQYAGGVFAREPLGKLLTDAEVWLRSPQALTLWLLPMFLFLIPPLPAAAAALVVYVAWKSLGPSFVGRTLTRLFRLLDLVLLQALFYVFMLSALAAQQQYMAVWVGLGGFILLRWGLVRWATLPLVRLLWTSLYRLPVPDQVLRALILRAAMKHGVALPELDRIERQILDTLRRPDGRK